MALELAQLVMREAREAGVGLVHITGGEPLLHHNIDRVVADAAANGLYVEMTTSTWSDAGQDSVAIIDRLREAGLQRMMLSYDDAHSRTVPLDHYVTFLREAQCRGIEVCAVVVEYPGSRWTASQLSLECERRGVDAAVIDWCGTELSQVGRAAKTSECRSGGSSARCPYILVAPTIGPDGTVYLCSNLVSRSALFKIGNVNHRSLKEILEDMVAAPLYRSLAFHGPARVASELRIAAGNSDMCGTCQIVLRAAENPIVRQQIESLISPDVFVPLDVDALLPGHRRFVTGDTSAPGDCMHH